MATEQKKKREKTPWVNAFRDPVANLNVCENQIELFDIQADGDTRLIMTDIASNRLIQYKGVNIEWESNLMDTPIAIKVWEIQGQQSPYLAIACDTFIYIYQNQKANRRIEIPQIEMAQKEKNLWQNQTLDTNTFKEFLAKLQELKKDSLSNISLIVLGQASTRQSYEMFKQYKETNLNIPDTCVCIGYIKNSQSVSGGKLIVGTEYNKLHLTKDNGFEFDQTFDLPGTPVQIVTHGSYKDNYNIFVGLRQNKIIQIQNGELIKRFIDLSSKLSSFIFVLQNIYASQMNETITCYTESGSKLFATKLGHQVTALQPMEYERSKFFGYLVALSNQEIRIYKEKLLVYILKVDGIVTAMKYGKFGREDGSLVLVYQDKGLDVKFLIRQFNFMTYVQQAQEKQNEQINEQDIQPLNLPKKSKLFLENSSRERQDPIPIHKTFQKDLMKLRLQTAETYYNTMSDGNIQNMLSQEQNLRMQVSLVGIGPTFQVQFNVENLSNAPITELYVIYSFDSNIFKLLNPVYKIPFLMPNISYPVQFMVENIDQNGQGDSIKILICERKNSKPLIGAIVPIPVSEIRD